jgi:hypothetical protein
MASTRQNAGNGNNGPPATPGTPGTPGTPATPATPATPTTTISDSDVELFNNRIKTDFDLSADIQTLKRYLSDRSTISNIHSILKGQKINKTLINFNQDDVFNSIAYAMQNTISLSKQRLEKYYSDLVYAQQPLIKQTVYTEISDRVLQIKERVKARIPSPTAEQIMANRNQDEIRTYDNFKEYFLSQHIYNDFENSNNPLKTINYSYETYLDSLAPSQAGIYTSYYANILNTIKQKLDKSKPAYKDNNEIRRRIIRLNIDVNKYIFPIINKLLTSDNKCFIQNYGNLDVNMRPCRLYLVKERNMCDLFEGIYKMSNTQLSFLLNIHGPNWMSYERPSSTSIFYIYVYDKLFLTIINSVKQSDVFDGNAAKTNIPEKEIMSRFRNVIGNIYSRNRISEDTSSVYTTRLIQQIIKDIYTRTLQYNNKTYNCLALHRIKEQKEKNNGKQLCKIEIPELREIESEYTYKTPIEYKIQGHTHVNKPELWGSCFYNVPSNQLSDSSRQAISSTIKSKYNITPSCDNNIIDNVKCKTGCAPNNQDKYMAFDASSFSYDAATMKLNEAIYIPQDLVFLRINPNISSYESKRTELRFVRFNNTTKKFDTIQDAYTLNSIVKQKLFTIKVNGSTLSLEPNTSQKQVFICNLYNGVLYEYSNHEMSFSLNELTRQDNKSLVQKTLPSRKVYADVRKYIYVLSYVSHLASACGNFSQYNNDYDKTKYCMNELKNLLNNTVLSNLTDGLKQYQSEKSYQEGILSGIDQRIAAKEQELSTQCSPATYAQLKQYKDQVDAHNAKINEHNSTWHRLNGELRNWEGWRPDWWKPWEWIHKVKMTNDTKRYMWEVNQAISQVSTKRDAVSREYRAIDDRCNNIKNTIQNYRAEKTPPQNIINNNINPNIQKKQNDIDAYNRQDPEFFYQNVETYDVNNLDIVSDILKLNSPLSIDFVWKYCMLMYNNKFLTSNDDCIYIQVT